MGAWRRPGLIGTAVLMIAVGIGGATSIFSVADAVVLRPLPYRQSDRLVIVGERDSLRGLEGATSYPVFREWRQQSRSFESMAVVTSEILGVTLTGRGDPVVIDSAAVSGAFFETLGMSAALGRALLPEDDRPDVASVVLSDAIWRGRFGGDPAVIGDSIVLGGRPYTIVGVMPSAFAFPQWAQLWIPLRSNDRLLYSEIADGLFEDVGVGVGWVNVVARLGDGLDFRAPTAELTDIWRRVHRSVSAARGWDGAESFINSRQAVLTPLSDVVIGRTRPVLLAILSASLLVLAIACANVAGLLLMRSAERRQEIAVRQALGASRARIAGSLFVESLMTAAIGAAGGLLIAWWATPLLAAMSPADLPRSEQISLDGRVLAFAVASATLVAIVSGLAPAAIVRRGALDALIRRASTRIAEGHGRVRAMLVIAQVTLAVMLVCATGVVVRSFFNLRDAPLGFESDAVLAVTIATKGERYAEIDRRRAFYRQLLQRVRSLPGVESAAMVTRYPLWSTAGYDFPFTLEGQSEQESLRNPPANLLSVTPDYFRAMAIQVARGRAFTDADRDGQPGVAIVSEAFARYAWPGRNPIGMRVRTLIPGTEYNRAWLTVVGVAAEARYRELEGSRLDLYISYLQADHPLNSLMVKTDIDPTTAAGGVREAVRAIDSDVAVMDALRMTDVVSRGLGGQRFSARLFGAFAAVALALASVGLYSLLAYAVATRTRELGIRVALGAKPADVRWLVTRSAMRLTATGLLLGMAVALALGRYLEALLYGISARDPMTMTMTPAILIGTATLASLLPAVRATRVDPAIVLRED